MIRDLLELPEDTLDPVLAEATLGDLLGVLALASAGRRAQQTVLNWLRAQSTLYVNFYKHPWYRICHVPRVLRRQLISTIQDVYVDNSRSVLI